MMQKSKYTFLYHLFILKKLIYVIVSHKKSNPLFIPPLPTSPLYHTNIQKSSTNCKHSTISNPQSPPFMQQPSAQITIFSQPCPVKFNLFLRTHNFSHKSIRKCEKHSQNFFAKCETPNCSKISTSSVPFFTSPNPHQNYLKPNTFQANFQQRTNFSLTVPNLPPSGFNQKNRLETF